MQQQVIVEASSMWGDLAAALSAIAAVGGLALAWWKTRGSK